MAEVFLGSTQGAEGFSRKVAIKRVLPGFSDNEAFAKMFVDEAQISSQLVHPNIVSVVDFDRDGEGRLFLVMELVDGKDLDALVGTGLLPIPLVIHVIGEVLRGLGYAHDLPVGTHVRGVVHRDVSPHNVLLSWEGAVKVSDFGIAKARAASEATASVFIKGKPAYMSPEQANGQPLDGRSDLFAVGIMLWEMLVGRRLFVGNDTRSTLAAVLFGQIPRPRSLRANVPKDLERVAMKLLERDLPARYATAEEAIADLLECEDAPKAGRELLIATLVERFAGQAPVRHNRARSMPPGARAATPAAGLPVGRVPTLPDGSAGMPGTLQPLQPATPLPLAMPTPTPMPMPAIPLSAIEPSLGAVRNAPTGTLDIPPTQNVRRGRAGRAIGLAVLGVAVSGFVTFAIVSALSGPRAPEAGSTGSGSGTPGAPGSGGSATARPAELESPPPVDAGVPGVPAVPVDAAVASAPPEPTTDRPSGKSRGRDPKPRTRSGEGSGAPAGTGSAGARTGSAGAGSAATVAPPVAAKGRLAVPGLPSLLVLVNGVRKGETPLSVELPAGTYTITLKSQDGDVDYVRTITATILPNQTTTVKRPP